MEHFFELFKSVREYFNDFVGAIIPGALLAAGLTLQWADMISNDAFAHYWGEWSWLPGLAAIFAAGHTLLSLHAVLINRLSPDRARSATRSKASTQDYEKFLSERTAQSRSNTLVDFHAVRNYAMSVSLAAAEIGRRFMFLALFCYGTATACAILSLSTLIAPTLGHGTWNTIRLIIAASLAGTVWLLDQRGFKFEIQALGTPLAIACAELRERDMTQEASP
jgi:hypothetical protein